MLDRVVTFDPKSPGETILYGIDFVDRVSAGVTLAGVAWSEGSGDLTISAQVVSAAAAYCKIAGGTLGKTYEVVATVTTSDGQTLKQAATLEIRDR